MGLKQTTPPSGQVLTLAQVRRHLRIADDQTSEDADLSDMIDAATLEAEHLMSRVILTQGWTVTLDNWYGGGIPPITQQIYTALPQWRPTVDMSAADAIRIRCGGITSIDSIQYVDQASGTLTTLAPSAYIVDLDDEHIARVQTAYGTAWPSLRTQVAAARITFSAGWANAAAVPAPIKQWLKLRIGAYYDNRDQWTAGKPVESNEFMDRLLDRWRAYPV